MYLVVRYVIVPDNCALLQDNVLSTARQGTSLAACESEACELATAMGCSISVRKRLARVER